MSGLAKEKAALDGEPRDSGTQHKPPKTDFKPTFALSYPSTKPSATQIRPTEFQKPLPLITFSYTPEHVLEFNNSAMRYYVEPPRGAQLSYGYEKWIRKTDDRGRIDSLLEAWKRAKSGVASGMEAGVVAWRGIITKILIAPYEDRDGWELNVMSLGGTLYLEEHFTEEKINQMNNMEPRHRLQTYYGYAFESYCTSETPNRLSHRQRDVPFGWGGDVNTNVQWATVVKTKLGDTRMVIGGEVDCLRGEFNGQTDNYVELKTSMAIRGPHDEPKFEKKLLKFYFQSFLLGVPEIIVGFRTPSGQIKTTQSLKTVEIPRLVRGKPGAWDPLISLDWGNNFFAFLKSAISKHPARHSSGDTRVWRVKFTPGTGVTLTLLDNEGVREVEASEDRVGFLPRWYWEVSQESDVNVACGNEQPRSAAVVSTANRVPEGWQI